MHGIPEGRPRRGAARRPQLWRRAIPVEALWKAFSLSTPGSLSGWLDFPGYVSASDNSVRHCFQFILLLLASSAFAYAPEREPFSPSHAANRLTNVYDALNRVIERTYPGGARETFGYSSRGMTAYENQLSNVALYGYDEAGRKIGETNAIQSTQYGYNPSGDLTALTFAGQTTLWNYDDYGQVTNKIDAAGITNFVYRYDLLGRITNRLDAMGGIVAWVGTPFQGLVDLSVRFPRALPWAGIATPRWG
jgi:YD repeat-containing protein